jgi:hypothetical protein
MNYAGKKQNAAQINYNQTGSPVGKTNILI